MSATIFVMTHKRYDEPQDPLYRTLQVGKAVGKELPYMGDDTGDNISAQNPYYGELTGYYWIWKNYKTDDFIGVCHYRRFYLNDQGQLMNEVELQQILANYDVVVSEANISTQSNLQGYAQSHNRDDLLAVGDAIARLTPEYKESFDYVMEAKYSYYANLLITSHERFDAYCSWLFPVLEEAGKKIDVSSYDDYHSRVYGFLSELLLMVWIHKNNLKAYEARIGITTEKAETTELKQALAELVRRQEYNDARALFYDYTAKRPDVRLAMSDIRGEFPLIEQILYILELEQQNETAGLAQVSTELKEQIVYYRRLREILQILGDQGITPECQAFFSLHSVSVIAVEVALRNTEGINAEQVRRILFSQKN
ncbi:MAG: DUF4422 domain-containing protein [Roseburia sp.]